MAVGGELRDRHAEVDRTMMATRQWILFLIWMIPCCLVWIGAWRCEKSGAWMIVGLLAGLWCIAFFGQFILNWHWYLETE